MNVAVFSTKSYDKDFLNKLNATHHITFFETSLTPLTVNLCKGFNAICVFVNDKVDEQVINKLSEYGVQLIALRCAGFNNVDLIAAKQKNIKVVRVPSYSPQAVAEHAVALILTLSRKIHKVYNRVRESNFSLERLTGFNLHQKTVGVIGTGQIGTAFCNIMLGFGCKVIAYDITENQDLKQKGVLYASFEDVIKTADIVSLHCPLTPSTKYMINESVINKMKKGVVLINTSRGALINTKDVIQALKNEQIGYLGIDAYEQEEHLFFKDLSEKIIQDDVIERLMSFHNVIITPHQGFFTNEALEQIAVTTINSLSDFENNLPLQHQVL